MDINEILARIRDELRKNNHEKAQQLLQIAKSVPINFDSEDHVQLKLFEIQILSQRYETDEAFKKIIQLQIELKQNQKLNTPYFLDSLFLLLEILDKRGLMEAMRSWYWVTEEVLDWTTKKDLKRFFTDIAKLFLFQAALKMHVGQLNESFSRLKQVIHISILLNDDFIKAKALNLCGIIKRDTDNLDDALAFFKAAKDVAHQVGNKVLFLQCLINIGTVYDLKGDLDKALEIYFEIRDQAEKTNNPFLLGNLYNNIAIIHRLKAKPELALQYYQLARRHYEITKNPRLLGLIHHNIANECWTLKKFAEATFHEHQSLEYKRMVGNPSEIAVSLSTLGIIHGIQGELEIALDYFFKALNEIKEVKNHTYLPNILNNIGYAYYSKGELQKAVQYFEQVLRLETKTNNPQEIGKTLLNIGLCHLRLGQHWDAENFLQKSKQSFLSAKHLVDAVDPSFNLLILALEQKNLDEAKKELTFISHIKTKNPKNEYLKQLYNISKAAFLKTEALHHPDPMSLETLGLIFNKLAVAEKLLQQVLDGPLTDYELKVLANLHLSEILLLKAQIFENPTYIVQASQLIENIHDLAEEQQSHVLKVQAFWLKAKISFVQGKEKEARQILLSALEITRIHQLGQLEAVITEELQLIQALMSELETSKELPFSVRLSMTRITESLWCLQGRRLSCENPLTAPISFDQATRFLETLQHRFGTLRRDIGGAPNEK